MKVRSTRDKSLVCSFKEALLNGFAPDGGLYTPVACPQVDRNFLKSIDERDFCEIASTITRLFLLDELSEIDCLKIIDDAYDFDAPLIELEPSLSVLELFHGPTLAFKDFGARFLGGVLAHYAKQLDKKLTVIVVTTGDTGCAVAHALLNAPNTRVVLLYPSGLVSPAQEQQLTTMGGNVTALEVAGTIDDCNKMAHQAFADVELTERIMLTPGNSNSIARVLSQTFYYFAAYARLLKNLRRIGAKLVDLPAPVFAVPLGNSGNLSGGVLAKKIGLPVAKFAAGTNINDAFVEYLQTGKFEPKATQQTISSAMDIGRPNIERLLDMYDNDWSAVKADIAGYRFTDSQTSEAIADVFERHRYLLDPHSAVAYLGAKQFREEQSAVSRTPIISLATAHPAKFPEVLGKIVDAPIEMPERLAVCFRKAKSSTKICARYKDLREILFERETVSTA